MVELVDELVFPATGELVNFLINEGDSGADVSVVLILTLIGRERASCLSGIFSGGPIGLSSRLRLRFFSFLLRSSDRLLELQIEAELLDDFFSCELLARSVPPDCARIVFIDAAEDGEEAADDGEDVEIEGELIGVIVMDDLRLSAGVDWMGMISIPSRRSKPVSTELKPEVVELVIGVMLTEDEP